MCGTVPTIFPFKLVSAPGAETYDWRADQPGLNEGPADWNGCEKGEGHDHARLACRHVA